jgi:hypothetical protein
MACRERNAQERVNAYDYCILEVQLSKQGVPVGSNQQMRLVTIDNHFETLRFVHENLDACIDNIVRLQRMEDRRKNGLRGTGG